jgi:chemotaxis family two-component system response regulator Rcp1
MVSRHPVIQILLVEDNPADVHLFRQALSEMAAPHRLIVAEDGEDASDYLFRRGAHSAASIPDLVVLDLNLPRKSGFDVLEEIRSDHRLKRTPVVVFTSSGSQPDIDLAYELGANMYLQKRQSLEGCEELVRFIVNTWIETAALPTLTQ